MRRQIFNFSAKVLDARNGLAEYVASDMSVDSDREIVNVKGWRFDSMQKNAPFVDSHNYSSIEFKLGEVVDWTVENGRLIETVRWLTDVPEHKLATIGWKMCLAGMPPAVSVGFLPEIVALRAGSPSDWRAACALVNVDPQKTNANRISLQQQQKELSAVILGANSNAVAKAYKDGIIDDSDIETFWPKFPYTEPRSARSFSFAPSINPKQDNSMSRSLFTARLEALTAKTKPAEENLLKERNGQSEAAFLRAAGDYRRAVGSAKTGALIDLTRAILEDKQLCSTVGAVIKYFTKGLPNTAEATVLKALTEQGTLGQGMVPTPVADIVLSLTEETGAYKSFGIIPMPAGSTRFARVTALPQALFYMQEAQDTEALAPDGTLAGTSLSGKANLIAVLLEISEELNQDANVTSVAAFLVKCAEALSGAVDYACLAGTGASDTTNGGQTGLFVLNTVPAVNAADGGASIATLSRSDFMLAAASVNPKAIQRGCGYWASPTFIPQLMLLKDGNKHLVKTPLENDGQNWSLNGFPLTLSVSCPNTDGANQQICAFGHGPALNVGIRQDLEISYGQPKFSQAIRSIRVGMRGRVDVADATWFTILKTAAK